MIEYGETPYGMPGCFAFSPKDFEAYPAWICTIEHQNPLMRPMDLWSYLYIAAWHGTEYGYAFVSHPWVKAWDWRVRKGHPYVAVCLATEEEAKQREPRYRERLMPWLEDWDGTWAKYVAEMNSVWEPIKAFNVKQAANHELRQHWHDYLTATHRHWELHFETMYACYSLYGEFEDTCRELLGVESDDPLIKTLMGGFENKLLEVNKALWRLAELAVELKLDSLFQTVDAERLITALEESDAGRRWLEQLRQVLNVYGWRGEALLQLSSGCWVEQPHLALPAIRQAIASGKSYPVDEERKQLAGKREEAEKEVLSRVPEARRDAFEKLMVTAQKCGVYSEEHNVYFDLPMASLGWRVLMEFGRRFSQAGVLDEAEDIFFLFPEEVRKASIVLDRVDFRQVVSGRKQEYEGYIKAPPEPFLGNQMEKAGEYMAKDPGLRVFGPPPKVRPELKADLYGAGGAPGVIEGVARVALSLDQAKQEIQPGEILITRATMAPWTPLFGIVKGVVTDGGGALSHAVIVGREYGIPVVAGTREATMKISTGQRIRIDGDTYAVYILG